MEDLKIHAQIRLCVDIVTLTNDKYVLPFITAQESDIQMSVYGVNLSCKNLKSDSTRKQIKT